VPRFFVSRDNIIGDSALISGADRDHIVKTLRMRVGDAIELSDGEGIIYRGVIDRIDDGSVSIACTSKEPCESEPRVDVTVFVAVPKGDKAEFIVQKCVELGAKRIVFFSSSRCVSRPDEKASVKKIERLTKIAHEAAKQSERGILPDVAGIISYSEMIKDAASQDIALFFYERGGEPIKSILSDSAIRSAALITGPEGGFSAEEVTAAKASGLQIASLGKRILRCETAPLAALTAVMYHTDNF